MVSRRRNIVVVEQLGRRHDDAIVSFRFNADAIKLIGRLPSWARNFDSATRSWAIHPGYARPLAAALTQAGFEVIRIDKRSA